MQTPTENKQRMPQTQAQTAPVRRRKTTDEGLLRVLRVAVAALCAIILVMSVVLLVLPAFKIKTIEVEGTHYHSAEEIILASGIKIGDESFSFSKNDVCMRIFESCGNVKKIAIKRGFSSVKITVTEGTSLTYTEHEGMYYMLDGDFRAWAMSECEADFAAYPKIDLPEIAGIEVGAEILFVNDDVSYVRELISYLDKTGKLSSVSTIDADKKYAVSYVLRGSMRISLGKCEDLSAKHGVVEKVLAERGSDADLWVVVDVSNLYKPTYRALTSGELLMR